MDQDNQEPTPNTDQTNNSNPDRPHVRIFGADVDNGGGTSAPNENPNHNGGFSGRGNMSREEWKAKKEEWKQKHREQKQQWKMQNRQNWGGNHHDGGMFVGLIILFIGVAALLYTMGYISHAFWYAIEPFWPILLILWGASIVLGRHWFSRFVLFIFTLVFLIIVILYGLVKTDSPLVSSLPPHVVSALTNANPPQQ